MSWEEMSDRSYPCSCGKGTYTVLIEMDDWNRQRENRVMHCSGCAKKEKEYEIKKVNEKELLQKLDEEVKIHFAKRYMDQSLKYFAATKNKKEKWALAKDMGIEKDSISTFYNRWKSKGMDEYIRNLANYNNMQKIIQVLNIEDSGLDSKVEQAMELDRINYLRAVQYYHKGR
ncbi:hypothetical protein [Sporosarcina sp. G11-34]|uniref:hypothetical protein n=1 Tax=Sporosarcina sp. G11-34 TaxID=2849605 RepID=UPI0022A97F91|nr:hypothetical protein [Sporosarcina sp. G11-34]MCZ2258073.1 hypothetical protein [Sporosarcina sp. G11-34]